MSGFNITVCQNSLLWFVKYHYLDCRIPLYAVLQNTIFICHILFIWCRILLSKVIFCQKLLRWSRILLVECWNPILVQDIQVTFDETVMGTCSHKRSAREVSYSHTEKVSESHGNSAFWRGTRQWWERAPIKGAQEKCHILTRKRCQNLTRIQLSQVPLLPRE